MKKLLLLLIILFLNSCESSFSELQNPNVDEDGDPIVVNPDPENETLGVEGGYCYGYSPPSSDHKVAEIQIPANLPASIDLSEYLPEVRSQGTQGSCVAWATGYYLKTFQENLENDRKNTTSNDINMSPAFMFNQIKIQPCDGAVVSKGLELLVSQGLSSWNEFPYDDDNCFVMPTPELIELASPNKIQDFFYLNEGQVFEQTKTFLNNKQPIVIAVTIDRTYFGAREGSDAVYRKFQKDDGAHAMLVVGYDDTKQAFKVVNSWGKNWGNNGFVWIDYKAFQEANDPNSEFKILCEAWVSEDVIDLDNGLPTP
ncbi:C1 family peptidase [Namhaeicola litoreus]|uniref:C1 family peptidase n=1 Tax=Namhaeicola litoreus TaxID=1052145 RepID=A0ABW3XZD3_9FLAO